ncbi:MAG: helicase C-terminal domain-containing protein, partial [Bacteroidota bacterium]
QIPVRMAWAVTIHKSQGKTFDKIIIDLGRGAFEHGQTYVALSRCRTLQGIVLRKPLTPRDVMVDPAVVDFYASKR